MYCYVLYGQYSRWEKISLSRVIFSVIRTKKDLQIQEDNSKISSEISALPTLELGKMQVSVACFMLEQAAAGALHLHRFASHRSGQAPQPVKQRGQ